MNVVYITAGSGRIDCDACLRDGALAKALMAKGCDVLFVPTYTPLLTEGRSIAVDGIFYGGINVFLQQRFSLFRHTPRFIDRLFDSHWLLNYAARFGHMTEAKELAEMTISMLKGEHGKQLKELNRLLNWLETQPKPDLIVLPNILFAGLARPIRERLKAPVLCLLSGGDWFIDQFPEPYRKRAVKVLRERSGDMDGFLAPNQYYAEFMPDYLQLPSERFHRIVQGIDLSHYSEAERPLPETFTIGYRSQLNPDFGLHVLTEAFRRLKSDPTTAACRLRVAGYLGPGDQEYFDKTVAQVKEWGLADDFECIGELDMEQRAEFLSSLSVLCVPVTYPEPMGAYVPEALAAGAPVVAPPLGCLPEWLEATGGGLLAESSDPAAIAVTLAKLMKNPALADQLRKQGKDEVWRNHGIEHTADSVLKIFAQYCNQAVPKTN